jgi:hypothetical protein
MKKKQFLDTLSGFFFDFVSLICREELDYLIGKFHYFFHYLFFLGGQYCDTRLSISAEIYSEKSGPAFQSATQTMRQMPERPPHSQKISQKC